MTFTDDRSSLLVRPRRRCGSSRAALGLALGLILYFLHKQSPVLLKMRLHLRILLGRQNRLHLRVHPVVDRLVPL